MLQVQADALEPDWTGKLNMGTKKFDIVHLDPPYGMDKHLSPDAEKSDIEWDKEAWRPEQYKKVLERAKSVCNLADGFAMVVWCDVR